MYECNQKGCFNIPEGSVRIDTSSTFTKILHHRTLIKVFSVTTSSGPERTELLELLRILSRTSLAVKTPSRSQSTAAISPSHVLPSRPEAEFALVLVVARFLAGVDTLAAVGRELPTGRTFASDAALRVQAEAVDAESDFLETLVDVGARVTVG